MRAIEHAMGTTQVPESPQRIITIDTTPLDAAIALGIIPVGTIRYGAPPSYLGETARSIEVIGKYNQPNIEAIARLKPDLILGAKSISERLYPRLSKIAPTVFIEGASRSWDWQNNFRLYAKAMGQSEQAEALLNDYQTQVEDLRQSLSQPPESITISSLNYSKGGLIANTPTSYSGSILKDIGFSFPPAQESENQFFLRISREDLDSPDADVIFLTHNPEWKTRSKDEFVSDRIWSKLDAVQRGAVCEVAGDVWNSGRSILAAMQVVEDVKLCFEKLNL